MAADCQDGAALLPSVEEGGCGRQSPAPASACGGRAWRRAGVAAATALALVLVGAWSAVVLRRGAATSASDLERIAVPAGDAVLEQKSTKILRVVYGDGGKDDCSKGYKRISDEAECRAAMPLVSSGDPDHFNGREDPSDEWPAGCYFCSDVADCEDGVWFNPHPTGARRRRRARRRSRRRGSKRASRRGRRLKSSHRRRRRRTRRRRRRRTSPLARPICQKGFDITKGGTVFVGDSDIDYWHTSVEALPGSYNVGIGGQTCADVRKEIRFVLSEFEPSQVILVCGENDLGDRTVEEAFTDWTYVVEKIMASGAKVTVFGTKPEADSTELHGDYELYDEKIRDYVRDLAWQHEGEEPPLVFQDVYPTFLEMGNADSLYDPDEAPAYLHLGPEGYGWWNRWLKLAIHSTLRCAIWRGMACVESAGNAVTLTDGSCPDGHEVIKTEADCQAAVGIVGLEGNAWLGTESVEDWPAGCYYCSGVTDCADGSWFNEHEDGGHVDGTKLYCKLKEQ